MRQNVVVAFQQGLEARAEELANSLSLPLISADVLLGDEFEIEAQLILNLTDKGVALADTSLRSDGVRVDFVGGQANHRRIYGGGKNQAIAKAVGLAKGFKPKVLDLTAGLGRDAFVLATLGATVQMCERNPVVFQLLKDGLDRARKFSETDDELDSIVERLSLFKGDAKTVLTSADIQSRAEVIYLDPMFPLRNKSASVKKEMALLHTLLGEELDADSLLEPCLECAIYRVVVKRPRHAPFLNGQKPSYSLEGKSTRFDIYTRKKLPA